MTEPETPEPIVTIEQDVKTYRPVQSLFLIDVIRDRGSRAVLLWAGGVLLVGTLAYHWLEGWSYLDALYFCVISLATVGYGDLTPTTPLAKLFTIGYVLNGIVILLSLFDRIRVVRTRRIELRHSRRGQSDPRDA
jgi:hypothetical protein